MFRNLLSLGLSCVLLSVAVPRSTAAQSPTVTNTPQYNKLVAKVRKLGPGRPVKVKLTNNETLKGIIGELGQDHFTLINPNTKTVTSVPYDKMQNVKDRTPSPLRFVAISAALVGGIMLLVVLSLKGS